MTKSATGNNSDFGKQQTWPMVSLRSGVEHGSEYRSKHDRRFLGGFVAKVTRLVDFNGQFLDPRHEPPLLWKRGKRDLKIEEAILLQANAIRRSFARPLAKF